MPILRQAVLACGLNGLKDLTLSLPIRNIPFSTTAMIVSQLTQTQAYKVMIDAILCCVLWWSIVYQEDSSMLSLKNMASTATWELEFGSLQLKS